MPTKEYAEQRALEGRPIIDTRKRSGDRHKKGRVRDTTYKKQPSKWERRSVVAWDGEGANDDNGYHIYNLLANSKGDTLLNFSGLDTEQVFEFFLNNSKESDINVIYGGSYDVNMILKDVNYNTLQVLWDTGSCYWRNYRILWAPRKKFTVQKVTMNNTVLKTFVLWDVIGYFQSSFVIACEKWLGKLPVLEDIQSMKEQRSSFKAEDIEEIKEYNQKECYLLVMLVERLFASLDECGIKLSRYDGAGSIAAALLKMNNIQKYKGEVPSWVYRWAQYAYSGGRIEAIKCGTTTKPTSIFRDDINSAYPFACLSLPSYIDATWKQEDEWDGTNNSMVRIKYHFSKEAQFYPLWYRDHNGGISYPRVGEGVYWGAEVANLYKYYQEGLDFEVLWSINCTLKDDTKPFAFLADTYEQRKIFKDKKSMASESLKLGMNSVYGKVVQQAGYRGGRIPTYHQLLWGGQITAYTRAKLFDAAMQQPNDIISFATDAIFTTKQLELDTGSELGEWSVDEFQGITIVQAGVYFLDCRNHHNTKGICKHCGQEYPMDNTKWAEKYRGFDKGSLSRDEIVRCWETGEKYEASLTRFVGLGSALMSSDFSIWRTWSSDKRSLDIRPTGKRISNSRTDYSKGLRLTKASPNITGDTLSEPYLVVWIDGMKGADKDTTEEGIPLEVLVDEIEDGSL